MIEWWESFIIPISIYYINKYVKEVMSLLILIKYERNYIFLRRPKLTFNFITCLVVNL